MLASHPRSVSPWLRELKHFIVAEVSLHIHNVEAFESNYRHCEMGCNEKGKSEYLIYIFVHIPRSYLLLYYIFMLKHFLSI